MGTIPADHAVEIRCTRAPRAIRSDRRIARPPGRWRRTAEKASGRAGDKSAQASLVDTHIGRIRKKVGEGAGPFGMIPVTGMAGAAMEDVPGTKPRTTFPNLSTRSKPISASTRSIGCAQNSARPAARWGKFQRARAGLSPVDHCELGAKPRRGTILGKPRAWCRTHFNRVIHGTKPGGAPPARFTGGSPGLPSPTQAGVTGLRVPGIPQGNQNPAAVFDQMSEAQLRRSQSQPT